MNVIPPSALIKINLRWFTKQTLGTAPVDKVMKVRKAGKELPFYNPNGNYMVDLAGPPFGVKAGTAALLSAFRK